MINKWDIDDTIIYIHILIQSWFYPVLPKEKVIIKQQGIIVWVLRDDNFHRGVIKSNKNLQYIFHHALTTEIITS